MRLSYLDKNILLRLLVLFIADFVLIWFTKSGASMYVLQRYPFIHTGAMLLLIISAGFTIKDLNNFIKGFEGEIDIKMILSKLPSEFHRFYDLNLTNMGNIDAVVVGPTGVWTIEVKSQTGRVTFENNQLLIKGYPTKDDFLSQAYAESMALSRYVSGKLGQQIRVHPILVFSSRKAHMKFYMNTIKGVNVIGGSWLLRLLREQREQLNQDQIQHIASVIQSELKTDS